MRPLVRRLAGALTAAVALFAPNLIAEPAHAAEVNPYTTPGEHTVNGRQWSTDCELYTAKIWRCTTDIWGSVVVKRNGAYVIIQRWVFNNLTYLTSPRADWANDPLGHAGEWTSAGRQWRTECDTAITGPNACRTYIWRTNVVRNAAGQFVANTGWAFNNMVFFGDTYGQPTRIPLTYTERVLLGYSVEGRRIYAYQVGDPNATSVKMVLGQMHGEEPQGARTAMALINDPRTIKGIQLWVVPSMNPDGASMGKRGNANGVDLNNNFDHLWEVTVKDRYWGGVAAASEPETKAMTAFIKRLQPKQLVSIHQPLFGVDSYQVKDWSLHDSLVKEMGIPSRLLNCRGICNGTLTGWTNANTPGAAITIEYGYTPTNTYVTVTARDALVKVLGGRYA